MRITLIDQRTMRLAFNYIPATVAFVKALPGAEWDKPSKTWAVPLCHLGRIVQRYLRTVEIDYDVFVAREALWRRWVEQHNRCGVRFALDGSAVTATGPGVSPEFARYVTAHSAQIAPWLAYQVEARPLITPLAPSFIEPTAGEAMLMRSMRNAAQRAEDKAALVKRVRAKRYQKQAALMEE